MDMRRELEERGPSAGPINIADVGLHIHHDRVRHVFDTRQINAWPIDAEDSYFDHGADIGPSPFDAAPVPEFRSQFL